MTKKEHDRARTDPALKSTGDGARRGSRAWGQQGRRQEARAELIGCSCEVFQR